MGFNLTKGRAGKAIGPAHSITQKIAITLILVNLLGLVVISFAISEMSSASQLEMAERNWLKDTNQISTQAAEGVKWGRTRSIRSAYEFFLADPKLALIGFSAFNQAGDRVDVWTRSENPGAELADQLSFNPGALAEASIVEGPSFVVIAAPLPAGGDGVSLGQIKTVWSTADIATSARDFAFKAMAAQIVVLIIAVAILLIAMRKLVGRPLAEVKQRIGELNAGEIKAPVPHADKGDEIGVVARALTEFCEAAQLKLENDAEMVLQREQLDAERQANMNETERSALAQRKVVEELGTALEKLAAGDLTARVPDFGGEFVALQENFNRALSALEQTVGTIDSAQQAVKQASDSLGASTDELARRTEQQVAALEQTAATLDEITTTIKASSEQAMEAGGLVGATRDAATSSSEIVRSAITAMGHIKESSSRIAQILKVIDDIAFQTNLLALNAGVEAARAGDAGKGFAVVAQEVRDLAGRSATAAKEIKNLIEESETHVSNGVDLVNKTGLSMDSIEKQITEVAQKIDTISQASRDQAIGLSQVNMAINEMDTTTQKNAAMVQDSNTFSQKLAGECQRLADVVTSFNLTGTVSHAGATETLRPVPDPKASALRAATRSQYHALGNSARA